MKRKLIKQGTGGLTVYLPKIWVEKIMVFSFSSLPRGLSYFILATFIA